MKANDNSSHQHARPPLPEMETYQDAVALTDRELDPFYVEAFRLKSWLAELLMEGFSRLEPGTRQPFGSPQTGQAWRGFIDLFGGLSDDAVPCAMRIVHRFINYGHPLPELLLRAHAALDIEHTVTGDYIGPRTLHIAKAKGPPAVALMRRTAERWCDWLDALIQLETHARCQLDPSCSGLDLDSGIVAFGQPLCWLPRPQPSTAAQRWPRREIETFLIVFQPLAKANNWTTGGLLKVMRKLLARPQEYPCWSERDLASHRHNVLALPTLPDGPAPEDIDLFPAGFEVAICLCPPEEGVFPVQPLWS